MSRIAWCVFKTSVKSPVVKKWKVTLINSENFKYKSRVYNFACGYLQDVKSGKYIGECTVVTTDKAARQAHSDAECKRACDPNSELYWSM